MGVQGEGEGDRAAVHYYTSGRGTQGLASFILASPGLLYSGQSRMEATMATTQEKPHNPQHKTHNN